MVWRHVTLRCDVMWRYGVTSHKVSIHVLREWIYTGHPMWNSENHVFQPGDLDLWPMTFELIQDIGKVNPCTKSWVSASNGSIVRALTNRHTHTQTHRHTDAQTGPILYPLPLTREGKIPLGNLFDYFIFFFLLGRAGLFLSEANWYLTFIKPYIFALLFTAAGFCS